MLKILKNKFLDEVINSEVVYPADHDFNFFKIVRFLKTFLSIFIVIQRKLKQAACTPKG